MSYLCNRNRETKIDNNKVPWMSGLVSGLQNRVRRFESARNLLIMEANLWSDEQKSHQAIVKDKVAKQTKVQ